MRQKANIYRWGQTCNFIFGVERGRLLQNLAPPQTRSGFQTINQNSSHSRLLCSYTCPNKGRTGRVTQKTSEISILRYGQLKQCYVTSMLLRDYIQVPSCFWLFGPIFLGLFLSSFFVARRSFRVFNFANPDL